MKKDTYIVNIRRGVSNQTPKIGVKVKETKVRSMVSTIERVIMFEMETTTMEITLIGVIMVT